ncbi:MAG: AAA family ATPase [Lachnospiraceae bacterium]|nr:AAA family ATPase [Lachnospiraceae bacterium]
MNEAEARQLVQDYKEKTGKSQTLIAKELGVSGAQLSSFLSGTYKAPHTIIPKVQALLTVSERKEIAPREPSFVPTRVSQAVETAITYSHIQGKIAVVYGDAGIGKTMAINQYCKENTLAVKITISPSYASMSGVNELIADQLGVRERVSRKLYAEIITKLKDSGRVIIIDEAQHLTVRTLNHIRCMADESGIGITLVGNDEVYTKLKGSGRADFAQLFSRIGMRKQVMTNTLSKDDIRAVFSAIGDDEESQDILFKIARTNYGLRGAVNVYVNTAAVYGDITPQGLARMTKEMNIGSR